MIFVILIVLLIIILSIFSIRVPSLVNSFHRWILSLSKRAKNKFNISIAEVEEMDLHQSIVIGIACVANNNKQVNSILNEAINFIETNTEAELVDISVEIY